MCLPIRALALLGAVCLCSAVALACKTPRKTAPSIFELTSDDGAYVLAMVESPEPYRAMGYLPGPDERALLAKYPSSGVYRSTGARRELLWEVKGIGQVIGLFGAGDSVYLIETSRMPFVIWKDGAAVDKPDGRDFFGWFRSPWATSEECGAKKRHFVDLILAGSGPTLRIRTGEGVELDFDATTGELREARAPSIPPVQAATDAEAQVAAIVARWSERSSAGDYEGLSADFAENTAEIVVESCTSLESYMEGLGSPDWVQRQGLFPAGPGIQATGADIHAATRLGHELDHRVDLYRVPPGAAAQALCLRPWSFEARPSAEFLARLDGPTVLAATTWPVPEDSDWAGEDIGGLGSATLWSQTADGWRIVAISRFTLPQADQ